MNFATTESQRLLKATVDGLIRNRYGFEQRAKILDTEDGFSRNLWSDFAELGLLGIEIDQICGGSGCGFGDLAIVLESFGRGLVIEPYLSTVVLCAPIVAQAAKPARRQQFLSGIASGSHRVALAYEEPASRYAPHYVATSARRDGDNYIIDGTKVFVIGADSADRLIVAARTRGDTNDRDGISLFLVSAETEGVHIRCYRNIDDRGAAEISFDRVSIPGDNLLGVEGEGIAVLDAAIDRATAGVCWEAVGAMTAVNEVTLDHLKTREQFGRPIGKFQVLQHRMVDMIMAETQARSMAYLASAFVDEADPVKRAKAISAAKVQIGNSARIVGRGTVQLHGGIGMTMEYVAGHFFRRLTATEKMFGDNDYHLARYAAL